MSDPIRPDGLYPMRLQRFLARAGVASRRGSERLMTEGRVRVNGQVVTELGSKVDPHADEVTVDGAPVTLSDSHAYVMLNKPAGYLTTMSDPHGRRTVAELVPAAEHPGLYPVGRLDADTTGLLVFTTDGAVGQGLLHPSHHVEKHYVARVKGVPDAAALEALSSGVELEDGMSAPAHAELISADADGRASLVGLTIHEGRKRQVKRMMEAVGHPCVALHRDMFGPLALTGVAEGEWRYLTDEETSALLAALP